LPGGSALVGSLDFQYSSNGQPGNFSFLDTVTSYGYIKHAGNTYTKKRLPPMSFVYQRHEWSTEIKTVGPRGLVHAPAGLAGPEYQGADLYSRGLSGMLTQQAGGLYYKENLGGGDFSAARLVSPKPSFAGMSAGM